MKRKRNIKEDEWECFEPPDKFDLTTLEKEGSIVRPRVVDYMLQHELKKARKKETNPNRKELLDKTLIVSHNFYAKVGYERVDQKLPNYSTSRDMHGHLHDPWFYRRIMFPCFVDEVHWILIVWNFPRGTKGARIEYPYVRIYDSIHDQSWGNQAWLALDNYFFKRFLKHSERVLGKASPKKRQTKKWQDKVKKVALTVWSTKAEPKPLPEEVSESLIHVNWKNVPTQRDRHNCAFYVIQMAKNLLYNRDMKQYYNAPEKPKDLYEPDYIPEHHDRDPTEREKVQLREYSRKYKEFHALIENKKWSWAGKIRPTLK
jgi:hypothetical protein